LVKAAPISNEKMVKTATPMEKGEVFEDSVNFTSIS
jgi:hypothetical protein